MARYIAILGLGLAAIVAAEAGQIQIGWNGTNNVGGTNGLVSQSFFTSGSVAGTAGTASQTSYNASANATTFNSAAITNWSGAALPNGFGGGVTLTDSNSQTIFNMINQGTSSSPDNVWTSIGTSSMIIPIGVYDVSQVWTMLDNRWGVAGAEAATVTLDFSSSATGATTDFITFALYNGQDIGTVVNCNAKNAGEPSNCTQFGTTVQASTTASLTGTDFGSGGTANIAANMIWGGPGVDTYTGGATNGPYTGSSGSIALFDQGINLTQLSDWNTLSGLYLTQIVVTGFNPTSANTSAPNRVELSAVTVDSASAAPEPSTILLGLAGLAFLGVKRYRRA